MTQQPSSNNGNPMTSETRLKLVAATEALGHELVTVMSIGGTNPYEGVSDQDLFDAQNIVCALQQAAAAECARLTAEVLRRFPPG